MVQAAPSTGQASTLVGRAQYSAITTTLVGWRHTPQPSAPERWISSIVQDRKARQTSLALKVRRVSQTRQ